jgi:hypothetical protein
LFGIPPKKKDVDENANVSNNGESDFSSTSMKLYLSYNLLTQMVLNSMIYGIKKRQQYIPEYMFVDSKIVRYTPFIVLLVTLVEFFSVILVWCKTLISNHSFP